MSRDPFGAAALARAARALRCLRGEAPLDGAAVAALAGALAAALRAHTWRPAPADVFEIPKARPGEVRLVARLARPDRVVQRAALAVLQAGPPFAPVVHSYVPHRSALGVVAWLEAAVRRGAWAWSLDVVDFFPSVRHDVLRRGVGEAVDDAAVRRVVELSLDQPVRRRGRVEPNPGGLLQGSLLSPWLSNLYLRDVDAVRAPAGYRRYCDNLFLAGDRRVVEASARALTAELAALGLRVRARPAEPAPASRGIECLGYHIDARGRRPARGTVRRALDRLARRLAAGDLEAARALLRGHRAYFDPTPHGGIMDIDDLLRAGRFREALERIEAERARLAAPDDPELVMDDDEAETLLAAIGGDPERHAEVDDGPRRRVVPRGLEAADLAAHRRGERRLGVLPVDRAGFAHVGVFDVDGLEGPTAATLDDARALAAAARDAGHGAAVEDTGGRGHHVWTRFAEPLPLAEAEDRLEHIARLAGEPPAGVRRELFPSAPDADPSVRLPLGRHPRGERTSAFVGDDGRPLRDGASVLRALRPPSAEDRTPAVRDPAARAVLDGCPLLATLARRAATTGHLNHHERYSLAAVLAPLGPGGVDAVHAVIGRCDNYDHEITQHFVDRLGPRPMGCARLRERHPDLGGDCRCPSAGGGHAYPCPLRFARAGEPAAERSATDLERLIRGLTRSLRRVRGEP